MYIFLAVCWDLKLGLDPFYNLNSLIVQFYEIKIIIPILQLKNWDEMLSVS